MFDGQVALVEDVGDWQVVGVHGAQVVHHRLLDRRIQGAGEQVDLGCNHIAGRVDIAVAGPSVDDGIQVRQVARGGVEHAGHDRDRHVALRAVVWRAGDDARAFFDGLRIGEMHLHGHVGAGRKAGDGDVVDADVVLGQRQDRCGGAGAQQDGSEQGHGER